MTSLVKYYLESSAGNILHVTRLNHYTQPTRYQKPQKTKTQLQGIIERASIKF